MCQSLPQFKYTIKTKFIDEIKDKLKTDYPLKVKFNLIILINAIIESKDPQTCKYFITKILDRILKTALLVNNIGNISDY